MERNEINKEHKGERNRMERKCIFCEAPIELKKHGLAKFCSAQCRNKFYYQNKSSKDHGDQLSEVLNPLNIENDKETVKSEEIIGSAGKSDFPIQSSSRGDDSFIYSLIEAKFDAKNECNIYRLKCEQLEEDKKRLQDQVFELTAELDAFEDDNDDEDTGMMGMLSKLPENVISGVTKAAFENEHIREMIKMIMTKSSI